MYYLGAVVTFIFIPLTQLTFNYSNYEGTYLDSFEN